jgi:hypothetical protein
VKNKNEIATMPEGRVVEARGRVKAGLEERRIEAECKQRNHASSTRKYS